MKEVDKAGRQKSFEKISRKGKKRKDSREESRGKDKIVKKENQLTTTFSR